MLSFCNRGNFLNGEVKVVDSRTATNRPRSIPQQLQWRGGIALHGQRERGGVKLVEAMRPRILGVKRRNQIRLARQLKIEAIHQFRVIAGLDTDRKSTLKTGDA